MSGNAGNVFASKPPTSNPPVPPSGLSIEVSSDQNGYKEGTRLTEPSDIANYYRLMFHPDDFKGTDEDIRNILTRLSRNEDESASDYDSRIEEEMVNWGKTLEETDPTVQERINKEASGLEKIAAQTAAKLINNEELTKLLSKADDAKKTDYMMPVWIYHELKRMEEDKIIDPYSELPEPGTHKDDIIQDKSGLFKPYDIYHRYIKGRKKRFSVIEEMAHKLPLLLNAKKSADRIKSDASLGDLEKIRDKAPETTTVSTLTAHLRNAIWLWYRFDQLNYLNNIEWELFDKITPKCILIGSKLKGERSKANVFTVPQLISMQLRKLLSTASYDDVVNSMPGRKEKEKYPLPGNLDEMLSFLTAFANALESETENYLDQMYVYIDQHQGSEYEKAMLKIWQAFNTLMEKRTKVAS